MGFKGVARGVVLLEGGYELISFPVIPDIWLSLALGIYF